MFAATAHTHTRVWAAVFYVEGSHLRWSVRYLFKISPCIGSLQIMSGLIGMVNYPVNGMDADLPGPASHAPLS